ncbi:hypothetical protein MANES_06G077401v8 [Manihot esculenta]|uniref:Uncharacterized protein n=1 Tax=Manihot esculenta TaxID=3983 RepID=A0ACB7HII1_MANES|nr:hypothetical protein MANES_06G077401v8 [Manihot esculenta]
MVLYQQEVGSLSKIKSIFNKLKIKPDVFFSLSSVDQSIEPRIILAELTVQDFHDA